MSSGELTLGKIVRRVLLYIGLAFAALAAFALLFAILVYTGHTHIERESWSWVALAVFTAGLFWVTINQSKAYWRRFGFWLAIAGLLVVHSLVFVAILRAYPQWREIWFVPVVIVEAGLFGAILYLLFGHINSRKQRNKQGAV
jgi:FtsH-binding integral membrane protein